MKCLHLLPFKVHISIWLWSHEKVFFGISLIGSANVFRQNLFFWYHSSFYEERSSHGWLYPSGKNLRSSWLAAMMQLLWKLLKRLQKRLKSKLTMLVTNFFRKWAGKKVLSLSHRTSIYFSFVCKHVFLNYCSRLAVGYSVAICEIVAERIQLPAKLMSLQRSLFL